MRLVIMESPYAAATGEDILGHLAFGRACLKDCLKRGEAPLASHLLYTQDGVLDDRDATDRALGIEAGHSWIKHCEALAVYVDRGVSNGMRKGITRAIQAGRPVVFRFLMPASISMSMEMRVLMQALVDAYPEANISHDKTRIKTTKPSILRAPENDQGRDSKPPDDARASGEE